MDKSPNSCFARLFAQVSSNNIRHLRNTSSSTAKWTRGRYVGATSPVARCAGGAARGVYKASRILPRFSKNLLDDVFPRICWITSVQCWCFLVLSMTKARIDWCWMPQSIVAGCGRPCLRSRGERVGLKLEIGINSRFGTLEKERPAMASLQSWNTWVGRHAIGM